jgi:glycosyltransferase involved in cell wall biosynthesis
MAKQKTINVLCEMLYQHDLKTFLSGGGERYALDFVTLLRKMGYYVNVYQFSYNKQTVRYKNQRIYGIGNVKQGVSYDDCMLEGVNYFKEQSKDANGVFLLSMNLAQVDFGIPTLTVSHGIWWDCYDDNPNLGYNMMKTMKKWIGNVNYCISVDTNSIHAMQIFNSFESRRMTYIPNYVCLDTFKPKEKNNDRFKVIIPRRIDPARGYMVSAKAAVELSKKYDDIDFIFCGKGHKQEEDNLHSIIDGYDNIKHVSSELEKMHTMYDDAHISWTPTIRAEGTSLGVLESLASGVVPIVTTIGGLTDLVSNMNNGIIISPDRVDELVLATEYLYHNRDKLDCMKNMGLEMIKVFSKDRWEFQVGEVCKALYGEPT